MRRSLHPTLLEDLSSKMVLLAGPRQVGKTALARALLGERQGAYFNWDSAADRRAALAGRRPPPPALLVHDELHKMRGWKRWVKGEYDTHHPSYQYLVTGSARLDVFRKGGDSLQGRYHHHRLHPLTLGELQGAPLDATPLQPLALERQGAQAAVRQLLARSGFPEPFLADDTRAHRRWQKERVERFLREDVRDLEQVQHMVALETLATLIPERVGSPLSLNALREDLDIAHRTVTRYADILDRLYWLFRVAPWEVRTARSLKKERKAYLWDVSLVPDPGARFENLVASHLLCFCHALEDREGHRATLHYVRDAAKREVDFLVAIGKKPWFLVEAKLADARPAPALRYFGDKLGVTARYQVVLEGDADFVQDGVRVVPARRFLASLV